MFFPKMQPEGYPFQLYEFQTSVRADSCTSLELMVVLFVNEMIDRVDRGHQGDRWHEKVPDVHTVLNKLGARCGHGGHLGDHIL